MNEIPQGRRKGGLVNKKRIFRYNRKTVKKIYFRHIQPIIRTFICVCGGGGYKKRGEVVQKE